MGGHPALRHCHLLQAMKAGQGPGNEASQSVFGISLTTISPAHNTFNHWHDEHKHGWHVTIATTLCLLLHYCHYFNNHTQSGRAEEQ